MPWVPPSSLTAPHAAAGDRHEACPDCGQAPETSLNHRGKWYVKCPVRACHNTTKPCESPEEAWGVWDAYGRRERLRRERDQQDQDAAREAAAAALDAQEVPF